MMNKLMTMEAYFAEKIADCAQRGTALRAEGREDEAAFEKIRANVFDIYRTVLHVAVQKDDIPFFLKRTDEISANWSAARDKAAAYGDALKLRPEEIKLAAAAEIRAYFTQLWEVTP